MSYLSMHDFPVPEDSCCEFLAESLKARIYDCWDVYIAIWMAWGKTELYKIGMKWPSGWISCGKKQIRKYRREDSL